MGVLKEILELENPIEPDGKGLISLLEIVNKDKYVITRDNFRKMILILYRIIAKIPVIIMGETGCGKTSLIKKLNQLLYIFINKPYNNFVSIFFNFKRINL